LPPRWRLYRRSRAPRDEHVTAGQLLARIDDRDFRGTLDQAKADVAAAPSSFASKQAALDAQQQSIIAAARATVGVDEANQTFAARRLSRSEPKTPKAHGGLSYRAWPRAMVGKTVRYAAILLEADPKGSSVY
jgi:Biotin-lipoyl like